MRVLIFFIFLLLITESKAQVWLNWNENNSPLPQYRVTDVTVDASNNIWVATDSGVYKFDHNTWTHYNHSNSLIPNDVCYAIAAEGNTIWIGSVYGLVEFDGGSSWTVYGSSSSLPYPYIISIDVDSVGNKWIGTLEQFGVTGGGLTKYDNTNWITYDNSNSGISHSIVYGCTVDENNVKWIATKNGLDLFNDTTWTIFNTFNSGIADNVIGLVKRDHQNDSYWIPTTNGLSVFNESSNTWFTYDTTNNLPDNTVMCVELDKLNRKWISCISGGLAMFDDANWYYFDSVNVGVFVEGVTKITNDSYNNLWMASGYGLVFYGDTSTFGITDNMDQLNFSVYPNPFTNKINIKLNDKSISGFIEVYSSKGDLVYSAVKNSFSYPLQIDFSNLLPGSYFFVIKSSQNKIYSKRIVKL